MDSYLNISLYLPGRGSYDLSPSKFVCFCLECQFTPVKLTCYERLMIVYMFFVLLSAGDENGSLPSG